MEYFIGAIIIGLILFFILVKTKMSKFRKMCLVEFHIWHDLYLKSEMPDKHLMARELTLQTLHLARALDVLNPEEKKELDQAFRESDPIPYIDRWLEECLPIVLKICGEKDLSVVPARLAGVLMFICTIGLNPPTDVRRFLQRVGTHHD